MRAVIASIKPKYSKLIYSGEKTIELRKTFPRPTEGEWTEDGSYTRVYLYESGTGKVTGYFKMTGLYLTPSPGLIAPPACLSVEEVEAYGHWRYDLYCGWQVTEPVQLPEPRDLMYFGLKRPPQSWQYIEDCEDGQI